MIDPKDIRAGGKAVVTFAMDGVDSVGWVKLKSGDGYSDYIMPAHLLEPLPTQSATAAIDAEIVEVAEEWRMHRIKCLAQPSEQRLMDAVDRRRALFQPKDPVTALLDACKRHEDLLVEYAQTGDKISWEGRREWLRGQIDEAKRARDEAAQRLRKSEAVGELLEAVENLIVAFPSFFAEDHKLRESAARVRKQRNTP